MRTPHPLDGDRVALFVDEGQQNRTDLNGDGDSSDTVLFIRDFVRDRVINLGLSVKIPIVMVGSTLGEGTLLFLVDERDQSVDLNRDGDTFDSVLHAYEIRPRRIVNTKLVLSGLIVETMDRGLFFLNERAQGDTDLNGDGDTSDTLLYTIDANWSSSNLPLGEEVTLVKFHKDALFLRINESDSGTDLNQDGDLEDTVLRMDDLLTGTSTILPFDFQSWPHMRVNVGRRLIALTVVEEREGEDLNGDGDQRDVQDSVIAMYNPRTGRTKNSGLATSCGIDPEIAIDGSLVAFLVNERSQGDTDLNGDGDTTDGILVIVRN